MDDEALALSLAFLSYEGAEDAEWGRVCGGGSDGSGTSGPAARGRSTPTAAGDEWARVDPDLLDPHPDIHGLLTHYDRLYFGSTLGCVSVSWSGRRMTSCGGVCEYRDGQISIRLSEPLLKFRPPADVKAVLLHEMIHALHFRHGVRDDDPGGHGTLFKAKMREIAASRIEDPQRPPGGYRLATTHSMIDEVRYYQQHKWRCDRCGDYIQRAMNRPPQEADCWRRAGPSCRDARCSWHVHLRSCGGAYRKVAEPPGFKARGSRKAAGGSEAGGAARPGALARRNPSGGAAGGGRGGPAAPGRGAPSAPGTPAFTGGGRIGGATLPDPSRLIETQGAPCPTSGISAQARGPSPPCQGDIPSLFRRRQGAGEEGAGPTPSSGDPERAQGGRDPSPRSGGPGEPRPPPRATAAARDEAAQAAAAAAAMRRWGATATPGPRARRASSTLSRRPPASLDELLAPRKRRRDGGGGRVRETSPGPSRTAGPLAPAPSPVVVDLTLSP